MNTLLPLACSGEDDDDDNMRETDTSLQELLNHWDAGNVHTFSL